MPKLDVSRRRCAALAILILIGVAAVRAAGVDRVRATPAAAPAPRAAAPFAPLAPLTGPELLDLLNQSIDWYRGLATEQRIATQPGDWLILSENRQISQEIVALAFAIARLDADLLAKARNSAPSAAAGPPAFVQLQAKLTADARSIQQELDAARRQLPNARGKERIGLQSKISELQGESDLVDARVGILDTMTQFISSSGGFGAGNSTLKAQIEAMAAASPGAAAAPAAEPLRAEATSGGGLWDMAAEVIRLAGKKSSILAIDRRTAVMEAAFRAIRAPLIDHIKALAARGDQLAVQADSADSNTLGSMRGELDALAGEFKQTSALLIPLSKAGILLGQYRNNLRSWRHAVDGRYRQALKALGLRVGALIALLAAVFVAAEVWRRAVFHYAHDMRRRYQLLLLRKIAVWTIVVVIVGFAFASELGSIATFAGLITAGIVVAMQSVLVSIVGYFFLIGKYGIRVGDRVQIGDVTGEVIDIGLVRLHLMELGGQGMSGPTGRVVAFANSIVFQVSSGLFKQIPGVNIAWHEIKLMLPAATDHAAIKDRLLASVNAVLQDFRVEIDRQTREIQRAVASGADGGAQPQVQLQFSASGVEAIVRYPVHMPHAAEIDERVSRELMRVIAAAAAAGGGSSAD